MVFGGTGFLGRSIVMALVRDGWDVVAATRSGAAADGAAGVRADVTDPASVRRVVDGAAGVVNAVSLYIESGSATFDAIHVNGAANVATAVRDASANLVHVSGIGADLRSGSAYVRARGRGEAAVREAHNGATILRPSVMFGPGDAFLTGLAGLTAWTPVIPLFGRGRTRLQPVFVEDVAHAAARTLATPAAEGATYELGGPEVLTYREVVERVVAWTGRRRLLLPFPWSGWDILAFAGRSLHAPPITEGQVALMRRDNVVAADAPGFAELGLSPRSTSHVAPLLLA